MTAVHQRLVPELDFPPYTHVPGQTPHPISDPAGHRFGAAHRPTVFAVQRWPQCRDYLYGIDLFNHGYYWEAHEAWEAVWQAAGRRGGAADFLKGLIKLAAAGVKCREGSAEGCRRHARRAAQLFRQTAAAIPDLHDAPGVLMGLPLERLAVQATAAAQLPPCLTEDAGPTAAAGRPQPVFSFRLVPCMPTARDRLKSPTTRGGH